MSISPEIITALVAGGFAFLGTTLALLASRKRTNAEAVNLTAQAAKFPAEAAKFAAEAAKFSAESERIQEETKALRLQNAKTIESIAALRQEVVQLRDILFQEERAKIAGTFFAIFASSQDEILLEKWNAHLSSSEKIDRDDLALLKKWRIEQENELAEIGNMTEEAQLKMWINKLVDPDSILPPIERKILLRALTDSGFLQRNQLILPRN